MMIHKRLIFGLAFISLIAALGCGNKKSTATKAARTAQMSLQETEASYLAPLDSSPDFDKCKTSLMQLNSYDESVARRPEPSSEELRELTAKMKLADQEADEVKQKTFVTSDAAYLEQSLTIRAAIRSLDLASKSPLEQAKEVFDWVCRTVYLSDRVPWPAPPSVTLEAGQGVHLGRAYLLQAAWQQIGLNSCFIGPRLAESAAFVAGEVAGDKGTLAPVRLCGVKIGKEVYLFNHVKGEPVLGKDGKSILKWSELSVNLELGKDIADVGQVSQWKVNLCLPMQAVAKRMNWLEENDPGKIGVKLYIDYLALLKEYQKDLAPSPVDGWFMTREKDPVGVSLQRIINRYSVDEGKGTNKVPRIRQEHQLALVPFELLPQVGLEGLPLGTIRAEFASPFINLHNSQNSAMQHLIRGQFKEATTQLSDVRALAETARTRAEQDTNLKSNFAKWTVVLKTLVDNMARANRAGDSGGELSARQELEAFIKNPQSADVQRAWIWGNASKGLLAESNYLMALSVHERTLRLQTRDAKADPNAWKTVVDWWDRYLDSAAQAGGPYASRDAHAKSLREKAAMFASSAK